MSKYVFSVSPPKARHTYTKPEWIGLTMAQHWNGFMWLVKWQKEVTKPGGRFLRVALLMPSLDGLIRANQAGHRVLIRSGIGSPHGQVVYQFGFMMAGEVVLDDYRWTRPYHHHVTRRPLTEYTKYYQGHTKPYVIESSQPRSTSYLLLWLYRGEWMVPALDSLVVSMVQSDVDDPRAASMGMKLLRNGPPGLPFPQVTASSHHGYQRGPGAQFHL